ncbi:ARM repeat-containing protein [Anaeromyces robustus]|uniref:ARM repeat-containing protein n=1 Tax=Anaeromyces robustus TaxID=1754192 RepID=A0A1Y1X8E7_9FUNG|nr:ARM repeat-containing protein [Anaeromyces robustus]|eukprot:ORX82025.1 ARM repeat-containing protein [Anaeromyces robustus]
MWNFNSWNVELELSSFSNNNSPLKIKDAKEANFSNSILKSEEEIKNYSLNETLNSIERAEYILKNGVLLQKEYVYSSLVSLIREDADGMKKNIIPLILKDIKDENTNIQKIFGESFINIIRENLLDNDIIGQFIPLIKNFILSTAKKDEGFIDLWISILNEMIPILNEETISNQLISEMKSNIDLSKPTEFRIMCARIMGTLSGYVNSTTLETILFPKIVALCQDTLYEIRKYMSEQLNQIFKNLKLESFLKQLMSEYIELILDEEDVVRNTALRNVINIIPDIAKRLDIDIIYPTLKSIICEQSNKYSESIKEKIGLLAWNLKDFITTEELQLFINYYISVAMSQDEKDCIAYIYNLPCIAFISEQLNYENDKICEIINFYCQNKSSAVRISVSKCFHEFTSLYNKVSYINLSTAYLSLLKDNDIKVIETLFKNMSDILGNFSKDSSAKFVDIAKEIVNTYHRCKTIAPLNWRAQKYIVDHFEYFPNIFSMDIINNHITPLIFSQLLDISVVRPIKEIFCKVICIYLKKTKKSEHREKIHSFFKEMKQSQNYHIRYLFLVICHYAIGIFSSKYFCEYFLYSFIDLYRDPIPNIRIYLCDSLMSVRHCLFLFNDISIIKKFNVITNSLIIRNTDDIDLNNTNNIISDVLNYYELQINNKYITIKSIPKDLNNLTIDFFIHKDKAATRRNSLKHDYIHRNSIKPKSTNINRKSIIDTNSKNIRNNDKLNISHEVVTSNKSISREIKKYVLPDNDTKWYKNTYYTEIYNNIDDIDFEKLISEDQLKEQEDSHLFYTCSEQIKKNKKDLLEHFKYNGNQYSDQNPISKNNIKGSVETMLAKEASHKTGLNSTKKNYNIANKSKLSKGSTSSTLKSETSYSSKNIKILGDEKTTLKPKIISNTESGKSSSTATSVTTKKKINKLDTSNTIINKKANKLNNSNDTNKKKSTISNNLSDDEINITVIESVDDNMKNEHETHKMTSSHSDKKESRNTNKSNLLSPSKSSSIWSSSSSTTLKSTNPSTVSTKSETTNSTIDVPSRGSFIKSSSSVTQSERSGSPSSVTSATSTISALSVESAKSSVSSVSGKSIIKKRIIGTSSTTSSTKSKVSFETKTKNSNSSLSSNTKSKSSSDTKNANSSLSANTQKASKNLSTTNNSNKSSSNNNKTVSNKTIDKSSSINNKITSTKTTNNKPLSINNKIISNKTIDKSSSVNKLNPNKTTTSKTISSKTITNKVTSNKTEKTVTNKLTSNTNLAKKKSSIKVSNTSLNNTNRRKVTTKN